MPNGSYNLLPALILAGEEGLEPPYLVLETKVLAARRLARKTWGEGWDSNPQLPAPQAGVLPLNYPSHKNENPHQNFRSMGVSFILFC